MAIVGTKCPHPLYLDYASNIDEESKAPHALLVVGTPPPLCKGLCEGERVSTKPRSLGSKLEKYGHKSFKSLTVGPHFRLSIWSRKLLL